MKYSFSKEKITEIKADAVAIACMKKGDKKISLLKNDGGTTLDKKFNGLISKILKREEFSGKKGKYKIIHTHNKIAAKNIIVIGIGKVNEYDLDTVRVVGGKIAKACNDIKIKSVAGIVQPEKIRGIDSADRIQALAEGMVLGSYAFNRYKDKKDIEEKTLKLVTLVYKGHTSKIKKSAEIGTKIGEAINFARDLINAPGQDLTPEQLAKEALKIAKDTKMTCKVLKEKDIKRERMNLLTAVSEGALNPPRLIHLKYTPTGTAKSKVAIVGKGVTFDSGGYNLKPTKHIEDMKSDMGGAAALLGVMKLLPILKPKISVDAYIPATENMIDGKAYKPGDVIKSRNGKTVEILNTDAEGRLILADAIDYAIKKKPDYLIDLATLTGGVRYALGEIYTAIMGNNQQLVDKILAVSGDAGDPMWQLPLEKEYLKGYKEGIADLNNNGKSYAMTIGGALFLHEFVGDTKWAHLDIAESAWRKEEWKYHPKGGTGVPIQTIIRFLANL